MKLVIFLCFKLLLLSQHNLNSGKYLFTQGYSLLDSLPNMQLLANPSKTSSLFFASENHFDLSEFRTYSTEFYSSDWSAGIAIDHLGFELFSQTNFLLFKQFTYEKVNFALGEKWQQFKALNYKTNSNLTHYFAVFYNFDEFKLHAQSNINNNFSDPLSEYSLAVYTKAFLLESQVLANYKYNKINYLLVFKAPIEFIKLGISYDLTNEKIGSILEVFSSSYIVQLQFLFHQELGMSNSMVFGWLL